MCDFADIPHAVENFQHGRKSPHKSPNLCEIFLSSRQICEEEWLLMTMATCVEAKAIRRELCRNCVPAGKKLESYIAVTLSLSSGTTRNRTGDTRIFSPLLYQLSYGTICGCKDTLFFLLTKFFPPKSYVFFTPLVSATPKALLYP